jgi:hypothetical protein
MIQLFFKESYMKFLKHVGKMGDRKVAVVFRQIPGDEHMCLVVYTEVMNAHLHDSLFAALESESGQKAANLADILNRSYTKDGRIILQVLHAEGMLKKVQCSSVMMTPAPGTLIRLDELNDLLNEMEKGEEAVRRLAELDASRGLQDPADIARRMRGQQDQQRSVEVVETVATPEKYVMDDSVIANNLLNQAIRMENEARGLLAESERLRQEAAQLKGNSEQLHEVSQVAAVVDIKSQETVQKKPRGRTKKVAQPVAS